MKILRITALIMILGSLLLAEGSHEIGNTNNEKANSIEKEEEEFARAWKEAYKKAGVKNNRPTQEQLIEVKKYLEPMALVREKRRIAGFQKSIPKARKCFENANEGGDAHICAEMTDADLDVDYKWDSSSKANVLKKLSMLESVVPCVKKADSMKAVEQCFPDEYRDE